MAYSLTLNTGRVNVPIYDEEKNLLGRISFIPSDADLYKRFKEGRKRFDDMSEKYKDIQDGDVDKILELEKDIYDIFNYICGGNVIEETFGITSPLTQLEDGRFFFMAVLDGFLDLVKEIRDERSKKVEDVLKDYE